jgi:uncharacterized cupredoxin-like copper-binding protein
MARRIVALVVPAGLAALAAGCGARAAPAASAVAAGTQVVQVRATEFGFAPDTIRVTAGVPVRLVLTNAGQIEHDLRVDRVPATGVRASARGHGHGGEVAAHAEKGQQAWVEFTPTTPGTYDLTCTISGHKEAGMTGALVVSRAS